MEVEQTGAIERFPADGSQLTADEFLNYLRLSQDRWWEESGKLRLGDSQWVFRGHADANWKLVPSGLRPIDSISKSPREKYLADYTQAWRPFHLKSEIYPTVTSTFAYIHQ
jgi:hypothetical protein